jgi:hypothetical protein
MEKPWKVIAAFGGVFIAGSIFGGLLALRFSDRESSPVLAPLAISPPAQTQAQTSALGQAPAPSQSPAPLPSLPPKGPGVRVNAVSAQLQLPPGMAVQAPQLMRRYVERLDLTSEQKERITPLIQRATADLRRQQQTNFRETGIIFQHLQEDLAKELTPAQRTRLDEMTERQRLLIERQQFEKQRTKEGGKFSPKDAAKQKPAKESD